MDCPLSRKMLATKWEENNMKKGQRGYFGITIIIPTSNDPKNHNKNRIPAKLLVKRVITPEVLCMVGGYFPSHTSSTATIHVSTVRNRRPLRSIYRTRYVNIGSDWFVGGHRWLRTAV
jgi:hypothetical protein